MILSDKHLRDALWKKDLGIYPLPTRRVNAASIDLTLDKKISWFDADVIVDTKKKDNDINKLMTSKSIDEEEGYLLEPGEFILAGTSEVVMVSDKLVVQVKGKSSVARLGIMIHTAGFIDPGFEGQITLEISNQGNAEIILYPGMRICQIVAHTMTSPAEVPYNKREDSLYMNQKGATSASTANLNR